jgi:murein DD-endopeptidase MepM/ murein hydrolase activator NlpD
LTWPLEVAFRAVASGFYDARAAPVYQHAAIDWPCPIGTRVRAAVGGRVQSVPYYADGGLTVELDHPDGTRTRYMHLSTVDVAAGYQVAGGGLIANSGNSGTASTGPHLHFAVWAGSRADALTVQADPYLTRQGRYAVDPLRVLGLAADMTPEENAALGRLDAKVDQIYRYLFGTGPDFPFDPSFRPAKRPIGSYVPNRASWWDHILSAEDNAEAAKRPRQA